MGIGGIYCFLDFVLRILDMIICVIFIVVQWLKDYYFYFIDVRIENMKINYYYFEKIELAIKMSFNDILLYYRLVFFYLVFFREGFFFSRWY